MGSKPLHTKLREKRNRPPEGEPFVWFTREMSESDALRTAPARTIHFVLRLMVEHMDHAGKENGRLICTWDQCVAWGIPRKHVKAAQADAIRRGLVYQTEKGTASKGAGRRPSKFGLGWLPAHDGAPAANLWKRYRSALNPREDLKSSSAGGTKLNGGSRPKTKTGSRIKFPPGVLDLVPPGVLGKKGNGRGLPPGWRWCKDADGKHVRPLCPGTPGRPWISVPIIDGVGDELERAARGELLAWREERGR